MTTIMSHRNRAIAALDALGPMPTLPRRGPICHQHPDADAWEQKAAEIGQNFFLSVWREAKRGNSVCQGYIQAHLFPLASMYDEHLVDDAMIAAHVATIGSNWTESLRALEG